MGRKSKYNTDDERKAARREITKRYRERHKEEIAAYMADYRAAHKEEKAAYMTEYYQKNKEELAAKMAEYYATHKAEKAAYMKQWRADNKEKIAAKQAAFNAAYYATPFGRATNLVKAYRREDRKYNRGECTVTPEWVVDNIFTQPCHYCGESDWHKLGCDRIDNTKPHTPENVVCCCGECNIKKNITPYEEFMRMIGKIA